MVRKDVSSQKGDQIKKSQYKKEYFPQQIFNFQFFESDEEGLQTVLSTTSLFAATLPQILESLKRLMVK